MLPMGAINVSNINGQMKHIDRKVSANLGNLGQYIWGRTVRNDGKMIKKKKVAKQEKLKRKNTELGEKQDNKLVSSSVFGIVALCQTLY